MEAETGDLLEAVLQHRTVDFPQNVVAYVDRRIRIDADDVHVVGRMMNLAQSQAVRDYRFSLGMSI
jgi:thiamine monophosphate synthase